MSIMHPEKPGALPLYYPPRLGFRDLAAQLIAEHPEHVDFRDVLGDIVMYAATAGGNTSRNLRVGQYLLDHGADANARNLGGRTPLFDAACRGRVEFSQMLLERGDGSVK